MRTAIRALPIFFLGLVTPPFPDGVLAQEFYCEGVDDDGDFEVDEGCPRTCDRPYLETGPRTVAPSSTGATAVSLVRPGTGFAWVYADSRSGISQVYVQITATSGAPDKPELRVSFGTAAATAPTIFLRSPLTTAVVWVDEVSGNPDVFLRLLDEAGVLAPETTDTNVSGNNTASLNPSAVWSGNGFGVVWDDTKGSNRDVYFQRLDALGQPVGNAVRLTSESSLQEEASIAWDGTQYAVVWTGERDGNREIYGQRIDGSGNFLGGAVRLTTAAGVSHRPTILAVAAGRFAIAWEDARSGAPAVWYSPWEGPDWTASGGTMVSASTGSATSPSLTTTGAEMLLAWRDTRHGGGEIYARRLALDGTSLSPEIRLTADGISESSVSASWHGSGFGVAHLGGGAPRLVLGGCGGVDLDQDGYFADTGDCNDATGLQSPAAPETCDTLDNTCDGVTDEGCVGTCDARNGSDPVDLLVPQLGTDRVRIVWGGGGYGVTWQEQELYPGCCFTWGPYFQIVDVGGSPDSAPMRLIPPELNGEETWIAWNGSEYAVVWENFDRTDFVSRIGFRRFASDGTPIGPHREVTTDPVLPFGHRRPVLIWGRDEYALTFMDIDDDGIPRANRFLRLDREGRPLERARDVSQVPSELAHLAFDGTGYGLSYLSWVDPYFRKLDRFGGFASERVQIRNDLYDQGYNRVAATPWGYGVTWAEDSGPPESNGHIFFQRFDTGGIAVGSPVKITTWASGPLNNSEHHLHFVGVDFALIAKEFANDARIVFATFDGFGSLLEDPLVVFSTSSGLPVGSPWLAWNGVDPLAVWVDSETGGLDHARPRSRQLACCENVAPPAPISGLDWLDRTSLAWTGSGSAVAYDRVRGDLGAVRTSAGGFGGSVLDCRDDVAETSTSEGDLPAADSAYYYLVRGVGICGPGTWNGSQPPQQGDRDSGLATDPNACP